MAHDIGLADRSARSENRIEITPEMIAAGVKAVRDYAIDGDLGNSVSVREELVTSVFSEMIGALRGKQYLPANDCMVDLGYMAQIGLDSHACGIPTFDHEGADVSGPMSVKPESV
jgi:hypothetical protein